MFRCRRVGPRTPTDGRHRVARERRNADEHTRIVVCERGMPAEWQNEADELLASLRAELPRGDGLEIHRRAAGPDEGFYALGCAWPQLHLRLRIAVRHALWCSALHVAQVPSRRDPPTGLDMHVIMDNASSHKTKLIRRW